MDRRVKHNGGFERNVDGVWMNIGEMHAEIIRLRAIETAARELMRYLPNPADHGTTSPEGDPEIRWLFVSQGWLAIDDLIAILAASGEGE